MHCSVKVMNLKYLHNNRLTYTCKYKGGCGKTTLLKCLIGILPIDFGNVVIFGDKTDHNFSSYRINLRELGFMPQVKIF